MSGKDTSYTHKDWRTSVLQLTAGLRERLGGALEHMHRGLLGVDIGDTQRRFSAQCIRQVAELAAEGDELMKRHDMPAIRVGEAQQAAGGLNEVAGDKNYNQDR